MFKKSRSKTNYYYIILSTLLFFLFLLFFLPVKTVSCVYDATNQEELNVVCQELEIAFHGKSLIFNDFSHEKVWQELLENEDYQEVYHLASLRKSLPSHLVLTLDGRLPDYRLMIDNGEKTEAFILNQSNRLKTNRENLELFTIKYQGEKKHNQII